MKANEAPEKIYCTPAEGGFYFTTTKPEPPFDEGIVYIKKDDFIEKACAYLDSIGHRYIIAAFKNYMEREKV